MNAIKQFLGRVVYGLVKPFAKRQLQALVQKQGDILQARVLYVYDTDGPKGIDRAFDGFQLKTVALLHDIKFMPDWMRKSSIGIVQDYGDDLQAKVKKAAATGGHLAIEKAFDTAQEILIARIAAL